MKRLTLVCIGALAAGSMAATPALAQHISPANTNFDAIGPAQLTKGATSLSCTLTLSGTTGPDVGGGVADGGTITGGPIRGRATARS